jgi:hypothetical protein
MTLLEETIFDSTGRIANGTFGECPRANAITFWFG